MDRHVLSMLVDNESGVLSRVAGLFSRRGYNIDSLTVGVTHNPKYSRMTIVTRGDEMIIDQIIKQLEKLIDVAEVIDLTPDNSVYRELSLIKVKSTPQTRPELVAIADIFRASIVDVSSMSVTYELTGDEAKLAAFIELCEPYGIKELVRTGLTALERGNIELVNHMTDRIDT